MRVLCESDNRGIGGQKKVKKAAPETIGVTIEQLTQRTRAGACKQAAQRISESLNSRSKEWINELNQGKNKERKHQK